MDETPTTAIAGYHAHIYYDAGTRDAAARIRERLDALFEVELGRWRDKPVGPHSKSMYQVAFAPDQFPLLVPWLALNRAGLAILIHTRTGDDVADHSDFAMWLGEKLPLDLSVLAPADGD